jgi:hypothetical protein
MLLRHAEIGSRDDFGDLLVGLGLTGEAAEVGAHRGEFAARLLASWPGRPLYLVDTWAAMPGYDEQAASLPNRGLTREDDRDACLIATAPCRDRVKVLRMASLQAAATFGDGQLDFVHIDADHRREHVEADLAAWWPKLGPGGVLAGHDFVSHGDCQDSAGVQPAVLAFAAREGVDVWLVPERNLLPWSFYMIKPGGTT